jgi:hypothetical protein
MLRTSTQRHERYGSNAVNYSRPEQNVEEHCTGDSEDGHEPCQSGACCLSPSGGRRGPCTARTAPVRESRPNSIAAQGSAAL